LHNQSHEKNVRNGHFYFEAAAVGPSACLQAEAQEAQEGLRMVQVSRRRIKKEQQRLVLCHLIIDLMRTIHGAYAPANEPFGTRLETFFIGLCVAIGDLGGKPFSVAKIARYMQVPRTTVIRRLDQLGSWGLIDRSGRRYYAQEKNLNSLIGMRSYAQVRRFLQKATEQLTVLDASPD
jgi:biotin operon repressor